ncbi:cell envelope integrity protein TolA [Cupriavidus necator]
MKATAPRNQPLRDRGTLWCFLLALVMHLLLGILLIHSMQWQSRPPAGVQAERWDSVAKTTAAVREPVVEPQPAPPVRAKAEAENALQHQKSMKRHRAVVAARQGRETAERHEAAAHKEAGAKRHATADSQRQNELARLEALAARAIASSSVGNHAGTGAGGALSAGYGERVRRRVKPNIFFTEDLAGNPAAVVAVQLAPDGSVLSARLTKPSGNPAWDAAVLRAVERSSPLPRDDNGIGPSTLIITFKPKD